MPPVRRVRQPRNARAAKCRTVCGTAFADADLPDLRKREILIAALTATKEQLEPDLTHLHAQLERAPTSNRLHLQFFIRVKSQRTLRSWKRTLDEHFPRPPHLEFARGSINDNIDYCSKLDTRPDEPDLQYSINIGARSEPGKRNDLLKARDAYMAADRALNYAECILNDETFALIKYPGAVNALTTHRLLTAHNNADGVRTIVLHGSTGTGKTKWVHEHFAGKLWTAPIPGASTHWYDGYVGQEVALFDDIDTESAMPISQLKRVLDRYAVSVPIKGGHTTWAPRLVVITTNDPDPIADWYPTASAVHRAAIARRLPTIVDTDADNWQEQPVVSALAALF